MAKKTAKKTAKRKTAKPTAKGRGATPKSAAPPKRAKPASPPKKAAAPKGTANKAAEEPITVDTRPVISQNMAIAIVMLVVLVLGAFVWSSLMAQPEAVDTPDSFAANAPPAPNPVAASMTIITDPSCALCTENNLPEVMEQVFPGIKITTVTAGEAGEMIGSLNIRALPAYVFSRSVDQMANFSEARASFRDEGDYYVLDERAIPDLPMRYFDAPSPEGEPATGNSSAPVTLIEFADPACSACKHFFLNTKPMLEEAYGDKINFVFKSMPLAPQTVSALVAMDCADEQGKFWEFSDAVYAGTASDGLLASTAEELALNSTQFSLCLNNTAVADEVMADRDEAIGYGVMATPTLFINGIKITGVPSDEILKGVIDWELEQ